MNEFELIKSLTEKLATSDIVVRGPGDDCAVIDLGLGDAWVLFKTDAVVQGIHFTLEAAPEQIGRKALARALSDIAAMAGTPKAAVITLGLPTNFDPDFIQRIYAGLNELATEHQVAIVGGETTSNPERLLISVSMLGMVSKQKCPSRAGAKAGDTIFVTGTLGGSILGKHFTFEPRLAEARWLAANFPPTSMMDLSDGLAGDLRHILQAGNVGAELHAASIPISREAKVRFREHPSAKPPLLAALTDGEDFELLFTVPATQSVPLLDAWKAEFPKVKLTCIGRIKAEPGLSLREQYGTRKLEAHGYVHFQKPSGDV